MEFTEVNDEIAAAIKAGDTTAQKVAENEKEKLLAYLREHHRLHRSA